MKALSLLILFALCVGGLSSVSMADILMSLDSASASFVQGTGIREVRILSRSTANEQVIGLTTDFSLTGGGKFAFVSQADFNRDNIDQDPMSPTFGQIVTTGPFATKFFSESGFIGFTNITRGGGSSLLAGPGDTTGFMSLEFTAPQLFPAAATPVGKLRIDITGLNPGIYPIVITDALASGTVGPLNTSFTSGSFTIVAVPEPTSLALVVGVSLIGFSARRRRIAVVR